MNSFWNGFEKKAGGKHDALWNAAGLGAGVLGGIGGYKLYKGIKKSHKKPEKKVSGK